MSRHIKNLNLQKDEFDIAWEKKFGNDNEAMKFDSLEEFHDWLKEVEKFDPLHNQ